ncbi:mycobactin lysine-N-oxygenase [Roseateles sp. YR242]|nr:mycobactin lysine-N-oxygenase [Roseateles sp. YR242]
MAAHYSWGRFLHQRPIGYEQGFSTWLDAGRRPPYHGHYADYLAWVVDASRPRVVTAEVTALAKEDGFWRLSSRSGDGRAQTDPTQFNGVVVTGPGPARKIPLSRKRSAEVPHEKIFNGQDFWLRLKEVRRCLKEMEKVSNDDAQIVIAGAGGTAAAVLSWLIGAGARDRRIVIVATQASLYTRVDSVFENRLFSDETAWSSLSPESRRAFFDRLNRGVVWATVMDRVSTATALTMLDGKAKRIRVDSKDQWFLSVESGDKSTIQLRPSFLIDATGFNPWWFLPMVKGLPRADRKPTKATTEGWERSLSKHLRLAGGIWDEYPSLHVPMVSSHVGPGYGSLMVLGGMADHILGAY